MFSGTACRGHASADDEGSKHGFEVQRNHQFMGGKGKGRQAGYVTTPSADAVPPQSETFLSCREPRFLAVLVVCLVIKDQKNDQVGCGVVLVESITPAVDLTD